MINNQTKQELWEHELKMHRNDGLGKRSWENGMNDSLIEFKEFLNFEK